MLSKKEIKDIQSLGHKKHRDDAGLFIAEGPKIVSELLKGKQVVIDMIYALPEWFAQNENVDANVKDVTDVEMERITQLKQPNQVLAVVQKFASAVPDGKGLSLYLDRIQDPGNFGTIIRIADWFNIKNIVCSNGCADLYNSKVVQATMGSIARINVYYDTDGEWLMNQKQHKLAATLDGKSVYEVHGLKEGILIIGNESQGIHPDILEQVNERISIPRIGNAESLNAAVATAILLSHLVKE